jgi:hypothetical protein
MKGENCEEYIMYISKRVVQSIIDSWKYPSYYTLLSSNVISQNFVIWKLEWDILDIVKYCNKQTRNAQGIRGNV